MSAGQHASPATDIDISRHAGLAHVLMRRHRYDHPGVRGSLEIDDLMQEALLVLHRVASRFDPERGVTFASFAAPWLRQAMSRAIANDSRVVRTPVGKQSQRRARGEHMHAAVSSLDVPLGESSDETRLDRLADDAARRPDELANREHADRRRVLLELFAVARLTPRERDVLERRARGEMLKDVARGYGVCRERVRQVELAALRRLRRAAERLGLTSEVVL